MASSPPGLPTQETLEAFTVRVLRYLDGQLSPEELQHLKEALGDHAACRNVFVQVCRLHGYLYEVFAPRRPALQPSATGVSAASDAPAPIPADPLRGGPLDQTDLLAEPPGRDVGADTVLGELSGEDTWHRNPDASPPEG